MKATRTKKSARPFVFKMGALLLYLLSVLAFCAYSAFFVLYDAINFFILLPLSILYVLSRIYQKFWIVAILSISLIVTYLFTFIVKMGVIGEPIIIFRNVFGTNYHVYLSKDWLPWSLFSSGEYWGYLLMLMLLIVGFVFSELCAYFFRKYLIAKQQSGR